MNTKIKLRVWGKYACFTNPYFPERYSYPIPTPSSLVGLLSSIYWKPEMNWKIHNISLLSEVKYQKIKLNEIKTIKSTRTPINIEAERLQINTNVLVGPHYIIEASIMAKDDLVKHISIFKRRVNKGQCFKNPFFGTKECLAHFKLADEEKPININKDFGMMIHSIDYENKKCKLFQACAVNGIVNMEDVIGEINVR